jgi:tetratricopeptide (TPR) repeat protein
MILSVSPVPFKATYSGQDAIVANTYSKSVLRAAAEEFVEAHDNVDYFPSFEMVTLSDRKAAYCDDNIHVQPAMVNRIMELAVSRYVPGYEPVESDDDDLSRFGEKPRQLLAAAVDLLSDRQYAIAAKLLQAIDDSSAIEISGATPAEFYLLLGTTLARAGRNIDAEPHLARAVALAPGNPVPVFKLGIISARLRRPYALYHLERAAQMDPGSAKYAVRLAAQYERLNRFDDALAAYRKALSIEPDDEEWTLAVERLTRLSGAPEGKAVAA